MLDRRLESNFSEFLRVYKKDKRIFPRGEGISCKIFRNFLPCKKVKCVFLRGGRMFYKKKWKIYKIFHKRKNVVRLDSVTKRKDFLYVFIEEQLSWKSCFPRKFPFVTFDTCRRLEFISNPFHPVCITIYDPRLCTCTRRRKFAPTAVRDTRVIISWCTATGKLSLFPPALRKTGDTPGHLVIFRIEHESERFDASHAKSFSTGRILLPLQARFWHNK